jgi:pimeloyl-ACP methyl ester carboxylesterase
VVQLFAQKEGEPDTVYLVGVSEGGLITALAIEGWPDLFDGGLAMCGPYGDFAHQINHLGDMRAVFDYFFPGLIPGSPVDIPNWLVTGWESYYETTVQPQLQDPANEGKVTQLLSVTGVASEPNVAGAREQVIYDVLSYNVEGTNDAAAKLGGQPFDNQDRVYTGSDDDARLNREIQRFGASAQAAAEVKAGYQTTGVLQVPLVTLHTTGDHVVPYWQAIRYRAKTISADNIALHEPREVVAYGHCRFAPNDVLAAFNRLVAMVEDRPAYRPVQRAFLPVASRIE